MIWAARSLFTKEPTPSASQTHKQLRNTGKESSTLKQASDRPKKTPPTNPTEKKKGLSTLRKTAFKARSRHSKEGSMEKNGEGSDDQASATFGMPVAWSSRRQRVGRERGSDEFKFSIGNKECCYRHQALRKAVERRRKTRHVSVTPDKGCTCVIMYFIHQSIISNIRSRLLFKALVPCPPILSRIGEESLARATICLTCLTPWFRL